MKRLLLRPLCKRTVPVGRTRPRHLWVLAGLFICILATTGLAQDYTWITNSGTITITDYTGPGGDVTVPSNLAGKVVTHLGTNAFSEVTTLTSVTLPDSITTIEEGAFTSCSNLTSVAFGDSVTTIGNGVFAFCGNLLSATLPNSITNMGGLVFNQCYRLASVTLPNNITAIQAYTFDACASLASVTLPNSVTA
ncbi:MAG: leucine-rich repeat domain-containing protein, partial [Kiritimatiellia bacterium]|nr:leucine-rich repeat domain-containing protein [Kiritimatiellia bacterium]